MKCIVGLGNIGKEYENTRHNTGFLMVDNLCDKYGIKINKKMKKFIYGEGNINGTKIALIKPTTFMNLSGEAIVEIMNWYKISLNDILIIYDDIDIPLGEIRYREKGSGGTHNGMKNIISTVKSEELSRIRVGIENRGNVPIPLIDYVLQKYSKDELEKINKEIFDIVEQNVIDFLTK